MDSSTMAGTQKDNSGTTTEWSPGVHASDLGDSASDSGYSTNSNQAFTIGDIHVNPPCSTIYDTTCSHHSSPLKVDISSQASEGFPLGSETKEAAEILLYVQSHPVVFQTESQKLFAQQLSVPNVATLDKALRAPERPTSTNDTTKPVRSTAGISESTTDRMAKTPGTSSRKLAKVIERVRAHSPKTSTTKDKTKFKQTKKSAITKKSAAKEKSTPVKKPAKPSRLENGNLLYAQGIRCNHDHLSPCNETSLTNGVVTRAPFRKVISDFFGRNKKCTQEIPDSFWVMVCRKHYQTGTYKTKNYDNIVKSKLIKILAEVRLIDELCQNKTVWEIQLKEQKTAPPVTEEDPAKAAENAKQEAALANVVNNLHNSKFIGPQKTTEQVVASLNLIGSEYCVGLKRMLDTIQFLPSGMPAKKDAPEKPLHPIRHYLREAETFFDWLETPEEAAEDDEDADMDDEVEDTAHRTEAAEEDVKNKESMEVPTAVSDIEMECEE